MYTQKILDIRQGELCYMLGTVYLEMPSKPNVMNNLEDEVKIYTKHLCCIEFNKSS